MWKAWEEVYFGQCVNKERPSVARGVDVGCKCSAVPPLALVPLTALWRGKGFGSRLGAERGKPGAL